MHQVSDRSATEHVDTSQTCSAFFFEKYNDGTVKVFFHNSTRNHFDNSTQNHFDITADVCKYANDQAKCTLEELETSLMEVIPKVSPNKLSHTRSHIGHTQLVWYKGPKHSKVLYFQNWDVECENEHATKDKYKGRYIAVLVIMLISYTLIVGLFMYSRRVPIKHAIFS